MLAVGGTLERVLAMFKVLKDSKSSRAAISGSKRLGGQQEQREKVVSGEKRQDV